MADHRDRQHDLLQEAVSCASAMLFAIEASDMFKALPADAHDRDQHNHGCFLLGMLSDHLRQIQAQVDALDPVAATKMEG
ncbi:MULTISPECIES: hypothetical protein [unclassified Sphingomonas]|uniref:hypothetical protein n=1 Tax=unclassified Sphingomonas TaxID=196159 RepID=UPI00226A888A|nr:MULTISPECIES: hypothetical protein [unclassified Sphingomonas]